MKFAPAVLCWIFSVVGASAQFNETIRSGRPGQSIGAFCVGQGIFQLQTGVDHFSYQISNTVKSEGSLSNSVVRYGLNERLEANAVVEYKSESITDAGNQTSGNLQGISSLGIGFRYHLYTSKGRMPNMALQIRGNIPRVGGDYQMDHLTPNIIFVMSHKLSPGLFWISNLATTWDGSTNVASQSYTVNVSHTITQRFGFFIENYGSLRGSDFRTYVDGGLAYLLTDDIQLDILAGLGQNNALSNFFVSTGISWRTKRKKE